MGGWVERRKEGEKNGRMDVWRVNGGGLCGQLDSRWVRLDR